MIIGFASSGGGGGGSGPPPGAVLLSIAITPLNPTIAPSSTQQLTATGTYDNGGTVDLSRIVAWTSGTPGSATINANGLLTAGASGSSAITAAYGSITSPASTVTLSSIVQSVALSMASAQSAIPSPITIAMDVWIPPDVSQVTLKIGNWSVATTVDGPQDVTGVDVAIGTSSGGASYTGSPTVFSAVTIPKAGGTYWSSGATNIIRGSDGKILVAVTLPSGSTIVASQANITWGYRLTGTAQVNPLPGGMVSNGSLPYTMRLEYVTSAKRVVVEGDSLAVGYMSTIQQSPFLRSGPDYGYSVDSSGVPGSTLEQWQNLSTRPRYTANQVYNKAYVIIEVGINDLATTNLATYQGYITTLAARIKAASATKVFVMTPTPSSTYSANEAMRQTWLTWLRAGGIANVDGILDADARLRKAADHTVLDPAYDAGDGIHWNAAGGAALAPDVNALVG